jgi:DNA ligase 1
MRLHPRLSWRLHLSRLLIFLALACWCAQSVARDLLLAETLNLQQRKQFDVTAYLVSEKLDGVRASWDGSKLYFRSGAMIQAPASFLASFPKDQPMDGELWLGRKQFEALSGIVRTLTPDEKAWAQVQYWVFELPDAPGSFSERSEQIERIAQAAQERDPQTPLRAVAQKTLPHQDALAVELQRVLDLGGEGLMLHLASARYRTGRSDVLLKLKPWLDGEATVVAHVPGKGKYLGKLGALRVVNDSGKRFSIGTGFSDAERAEPPPLGARVSFRYRELTVHQIPRFPVFLRVRHAE